MIQVIVAQQRVPTMTTLPTAVQQVYRRKNRTDRQTDRWAWAGHKLFLAHITVEALSLSKTDGHIHICLSSRGAQSYTVYV
jgi:hypothetical protein